MCYWSKCLLQICMMAVSLVPIHSLEPLSGSFPIMTITSYKRKTPVCMRTRKRFNAQQAPNITLSQQWLLCKCSRGTETGPSSPCTAVLSAWLQSSVLVYWVGGRKKHRDVMNSMAAFTPNLMICSSRHDRTHRMALSWVFHYVALVSDCRDITF